MAKPPFTRDQQIEFMRTAQERMETRVARWLADPGLRARLVAPQDSYTVTGRDDHGRSGITVHEVARRRCV